MDVWIVVRRLIGHDDLICMVFNNRDHAAAWCQNGTDGEIRWQRESGTGGYAETSQTLGDGYWWILQHRRVIGD